MKKECAYKTSYEDMRDTRTGRMAKTPEAQKRSIDSCLKTMMECGDYWTAESIRRVLKQLCEFNDRAWEISRIIDLLSVLDDNHIKRLGSVADVFHETEINRKHGKRKDKTA